MFYRLTVLCLLVALCAAQTSKKKARPASSRAPAPAPSELQAPPQINWGKCPQMAPKEADLAQKGKVFEECLKDHPIPKQLSEEIVDKHQRQLFECGLKKEKWFDKAGAYRYGRALSEMKAKKLPKDIETQLVAHHKKCETEAKQKFAKSGQVPEQVRLYSACMDFHTAETCQIQLPEPPRPPQ